MQDQNLNDQIARTLEIFNWKTKSHTITIKAGFQKDTKDTRLLTCAQHNSFIIITKLFNQHKMNKVYANTIQNLDKSYRFKFFLKEAREGLLTIWLGRLFHTVMTRFSNECSNWPVLQNYRGRKWRTKGDFIPVTSNKHGNMSQLDKKTIIRTNRTNRF